MKKIRNIQNEKQAVLRAGTAVDVNLIFQKPSEKSL